MKLLFPISSFTFLLYLSHSSIAQEQYTVNNETTSWVTSPIIFSKRTTCSGTCAECYGAGSVFCGTNLACFNPTLGETCCAQYSYSCPSGYYCAPGGLDSQCCANNVSTDVCNESIHQGYSNGRLSTGAKTGIGVGVTLGILIIAGCSMAWLYMRRRNRRRAIAAEYAGWQMPELTGGVVRNEGGFGGMDLKSPQMGGGGGPPLEDGHTLGIGLQRGLYDGFVPSQVELPESPLVHVLNTPMSRVYTDITGQDRTSAAELYEGNIAQNR